MPLLKAGDSITITEDDGIVTQAEVIVVDIEEGVVSIRASEWDATEDDPRYFYAELYDNDLVTKVSIN